MAWEWSHTQEGSSNVYENIHNPDVVSTETIKECLAEFAVYEIDEDCLHPLYEDTLKGLKGLSHDCLADMLWPKVVNHATCDNGGFHAHICPMGCGPWHKVSFDLVEDNEE